MENIQNLRIAVYGCGKMGFALVNRWVRAGVLPQNVTVFDPNPHVALSGLGVLVNKPISRVDVIIFAVKPQIFLDLLAQTNFPKADLVLSIIAGVPLSVYEESFGPSQKIIRAMPNTPALVGAGITAIVGNAAVDERSWDLVDDLLSAVGEVVRLNDENLMDAVTAVSGSGPAYVFWMVEALRDAAQKEGLPAELANKLVQATLYGAAKLLRETSQDPAALRVDVTSPGGTTAAGLSVLMDADSGLAPLIHKTVKKAAARALELGNTNNKEKL